MIGFITFMLALIFVFVIGFVLGMYLTHASIKQDGYDIEIVDGNWVIKERSK